MARTGIKFQKGLSLHESQRLYGTEEQCEAAVETARWPCGFRFPRCDGHEHGLVYGRCPLGREGVRHLRHCPAPASGHAYRFGRTARWAMGVVNRCAVGIYPSQQLLDWARGLDLDVDAAGAREPCLYLIPDYETDEEAEAILEEVYEAIFEAELDYWHRDSGTWPAERTYPVFPKWFEVRLYPLIQDLVGEEITVTEVDEVFMGSMRTVMEGLEQRP